MQISIMSGTTALSERISSKGTSSGARGVNGRRGRRPSSISLRNKLERSRKSARDCRERKKLRYQYLEELVAHREKAIFALRNELETFKHWCKSVDRGEIPQGLVTYLNKEAERCTENESKCSPNYRPQLPSATSVRSCPAIVLYSDNCYQYPTANCTSWPVILTPQTPVSVPDSKQSLVSSVKQEDDNTNIKPDLFTFDTIDTLEIV